MVQVFMALRCYSCKTFQVHQVKKTNKWACKICNDKQSVLKTYGKGTGKECREHVQKLNMLRAKEQEVEDEKYCRQYPSHANTYTPQEVGERNALDSLEHSEALANSKRSKWTSFLSPSEEDEEKDEDKRYVTEGDRFTSTCSSKNSAGKRSSHRVMFSDKEDDWVCPYSSVDRDLEGCVDGYSCSSHSSPTSVRLFNPNRYTKHTKLQANSTTSHTSFSRDRPRSPRAKCSLSSSPSPGTARGSHRERIRRFKQDVQKFSQRACADVTCKQPGSGLGELSEGGGSGSGGIPRAPSRWSNFISKEEDSYSEEEEEESRNGRETSQHTTTTRLTSKSTSAEHTLTGHS